ncbi:MAG: hypothetical protein ACO28Y_04875 [Bacteroidia bacterium]
MIWKYLTQCLSQFKLLFWIFIISITLGASYWVSNIEMSYEFAKILPADDPDYKVYSDFKSTFGEDGVLMVIGVKDSTFFTANKRLVSTYAKT